MTTRALVILLLCTSAAQASAQTPPLEQRGSVTITELPVTGTTAGVNTLNPFVQIQGPFAGSASSTAGMPFSGNLSLAGAIQRGLAYNLGVIGAADAAHLAHGQARAARSELLPHLTGEIAGSRQEINLMATGFQFALPQAGAVPPTVVGPFNVVDARVRLSQSVFDLAAWDTFRASRSLALAGDLTFDDARQLVVLAVGAQYLQVRAAQARIDSARAQLETADALYSQATQQRRAGVAAQIDVNRTQIEVLTQRQRLTTLQNDLAKQKIALARLTGLPPTDQFEATDDVPFAPAPAVSVDAAVAESLGRRADLKAAEAALLGAERARAAAGAEWLPSLSLSADYGAIGTTVSDSRRTFTLFGSLRIPLWEGGATESHLQQADALVRQRRAETENLRAQIAADVRTAWLDVQTAASQVDLARESLEATRQTLDLTRQRFEAGVTDSLEVVRAQESLAAADLDYINSVYAHNLAKLTLARALGVAGDDWPRFLLPR